MTDIELKAEFMMDIIDGKYTLNEAKQKIRTFEEQYGADFFVSYDIEKKDKPWDMAYLKELKLKGMTGSNSKQFFLHLAEVSEYVHANDGTSHSKGDKKKFIIAGIIAGIIIALVIVILFLSKSHAAAMAVIAEQHAIIAQLQAQLLL
ncbi:MAG TPA: hypothetical protein P5092_00130 [Ruminococcus sp.]|nr:hypothetical protein [Ruminococcus sp.]